MNEIVTREVDAFNRRFRVRESVDIDMDGKGRTERRVLLSAAKEWLGLAGAEVEGLGFVACRYIHLPPGVGG